MFQEFRMKHNCTFVCCCRLPSSSSLFSLCICICVTCIRTHELISIALTLSVRKHNLNGECRPDGQNRKQTKTPRSSLHRRKDNAHFTRFTHHFEFVASKRRKVINNTLTSPTVRHHYSARTMHPNVWLDAECPMEESHKNETIEKIEFLFVAGCGCKRQSAQCLSLLSPAPVPATSDAEGKKNHKQKRRLDGPLENVCLFKQKIYSLILWAQNVTRQVQRSRGAAARTTWPNFSGSGKVRFRSTWTEPSIISTNSLRSIRIPTNSVQLHPIQILTYFLNLFE